MNPNRIRITYPGLRNHRIKKRAFKHTLITDSLRIQCKRALTKPGSTRFIGSKITCDGDKPVSKVTNSKMDAPMLIRARTLLNAGQTTTQVLRLTINTTRRKLSTGYAIIRMRATLIRINLFTHDFFPAIN